MLVVDIFALLSINFTMNYIRSVGLGTSFIFVQFRYFDAGSLFHNDYFIIRSVGDFDI